ncbi:MULTISPECIES: LysR family transcriptional regulator [Streptomyces]|uniref:LysR family transcriptional regulator n=1 Tax=Streptomyces tsukubensis (strain DSM 42081 / NBRC 108919 / NRRL 18488 / 9993) TaxID=1114943 RepID=I2MYJ5_STRT9|nr:MULTISPECIES: LysR family transcriptional regulator [Streptomyces]AZK94156.1 LysR family transcriptional regulator [Streptomyces tsukubensis]EIF89842.1 LysR family transcriptional regulator [Streptomyces tsukubensis NRRL18488]MYS63469.1 LysR family transcriptional regulator [Streptomyces sp. SID5473]QKM69741.1 LysR family transcriptional regulator [Streptomyces tsukubensis NRRL18488]TAI46293.1 LysR family transcriptional regulator [Streptomyces tsukubensis]
MLDLGRLRALHAVWVHGSVAAAAVALGYTPSAVSQQITKLERETRTTLLERRGRGVALTEEGLHLASTARELLAIVERAETVMEERRGKPAGRLTVAAFASAARGLLPEVLARLERAHPGLDVRMTEVDPHLSIDLVARGTTDLAIAHDWDIAPLPAPEGVEQAVIGDDLCDLLVPEGHRFAGRSAVRREELAGERWICQPPGTVCHDWLIRTLRTAGCEPDLVHQAEENHTQVALVAAGLGIAVMPRLGRGALPAGVVAVSLDPVPRRRLYALWRARAARRPAIGAAVTALQEHFMRLDSTLAPDPSPPSATPAVSPWASSPVTGPAPFAASAPDRPGT